MSLLNSYIDLNFDVLQAASNNRFADNKDIRLVDLGPMALFSSYKLTTSSAKHLEDISHAHIVSLLYKLWTSAKYTNDFSTGFDRDRIRRQWELSINKSQKDKIQVRIMLKDTFGFAEHQENPTYGLGYKITLTRKSDKSVLNQDNAVNTGKIKINIGECYVPHYTPSTPQQATLSKQNLNQTPTGLQYGERSVFMKEVNTQNLWTF